MRNLNSLMLATSLTAALAATCFTGCSTWHTKTSERTEGRMYDDHKIASQVKSNLKSEPVYKFNEVDVRTFAGVVQLSGFVNTDDQKRRAQEIAQQVPGVVQVENNISLKPNADNYSPTGRSNDPRPSSTVPPNRATTPNQNR